jgi:hypothetical protein
MNFNLKPRVSCRADE